MRRRRLPAVLLATTLVVGALQAPAAAAPKVRTVAAAATGITLITGDRVIIDGRNTSVQPGPGRTKIRFLSQATKNHRYVIPSDAVPLLQAGRLDKRLFDVTELKPLGADLPLLVSYPKNAAPAARAEIAAGGAQVTRDLSPVGMLAVRADLAGRRSLWSAVTSGTSFARALRPGVDRIWLDGKRKITLDHSVPQIGAPTAWKAGYDGKGVTVAILDTGIDQTHPDLVTQIAGTANFTTTPTVDDTVGHGTHVASIIAGTGAASGGRYRGVAPGAKLLIGKVCEDESCDDSAILAGMAWAAARAPVINMSLGGTDTPDIDPLELAVNELTAQYDTLFVIAAGNDGSVGSVGSPSTADAALSVGAVDRDDKLADFSSRGPRVGDYALKPDITAPGVNIVAAKAKNGVIGDPAPVDGYTTLSGTSMAAPHVAGAAAILTQEHPAWSSTLRKDTLMGSAKPTDDTNVFDQGAGRVDVAREITQTVTASPPSVSFGRQQWPHGDDVPLTRTVTYQNSGTAALDLTLAGPGAPFTVAATKLSVPAGGTASTTVTADTSKPGLADGRLGGYLTATAAGGVRVETPLGVDREAESYDVTLVHTGRDGSPSLNHFTSLWNLDTGLEADAGQPQGTETVRVPKGRYGLLSWLGDETGALDITIAQSELVVDHKLTVDLDARRAKPVRVTAPKAGSGTVLAAVNADWTLPNSAYSFGLIGLDFDSLYSGAIGGSKPFFLAGVDGSFADPGPDQSYRNSPYTIDLAYFKPGKMFDGLTKAPRLKTLATINASFAAEAAGAEGTKAIYPQYTGSNGASSALIPFDLPFRRTEYVNADARWSSDFRQQLASVGDELPVTLSTSQSAPQLFKAGESYHSDWNRAVFGPLVTHPDYPSLWASRQGDHLLADVPMFGEGSGHPGFSAETENIALYRGNTKIGEGYEFDLPPGAATYRLEATDTRGAPHTLSTAVSGVWTFRSGHVDGTADQRLPLSTVRFSPRLDDRNRAPAGRRFCIPVTVERQPGSSAGQVRSIRVEVSYNDGNSWRTAPLSGSGDHRTATVRHPRGDGFVSLRVTSTDTKGNTVKQTIIRAYAIG